MESEKNPREKYLVTCQKQAAKIVADGASIAYIRAGNRKRGKEFLRTKGMVVGFQGTDGLYVGVSLCRKGERFSKHIGICRAFTQSQRVFENKHQPGGGSIHVAVVGIKTIVNNNPHSVIFSPVQLKWHEVPLNENFHSVDSKSEVVQNVATWLQTTGIPRSAWRPFNQMVSRMGRRFKLVDFPSLKKPVKAVRRKKAAKKPMKKVAARKKA